MTLQGRVEPYQPGTYRFWCDCGGQNMAIWKEANGCTRIVNDSEINFRCETPIISATQETCMIVHHLQPLIDDYTKRKKKADAKVFLASVEAKKAEAMAVLGISEAQVNTAKAIPVTLSGGSVDKEA
jgi:hypothetical protein